MNLEGLQDIKGLVEIPDHSLLLLSLTITGTLLSLIALLFFIRKALKKRKKSAKLEAIRQLKTLQILESKDFAYEVTRLGEIALAGSSERQIFDALIDALEKYKYVKSAPPLKEEDVQKFHHFLELLDG